MKILQLGTKYYQPSYIYVCDKCGCKFQFFEWEGKRTTNRYLDINCPQCNDLIKIKNLEYYRE